MSPNDRPPDMGDWPSDDPTERRPDAVEAFLRRLIDHANDQDYAWANDTITDILATVEGMGQFTPGQERAITNIETAVARKADRSYGGGSRGYRRWRR